LSGRIKLSTQRHLPQLDGLRAFAILPVLLTHSWPDYPSLTWLGKLGPAGWIGVDLFFVLSGFLITGILIDAKGSENYFRNFYIRRGLRIWPLYFAILFYMFLIVPHIASWGAEQFDSQHFAWYYYVVYVQNFLYGTHGPFPLAVTWSLAIEEHFYLVWPLVVFFAKREHLAKILVGFIAVVTIGRYFGMYHFANAHNSFFRMDEMAYGALIACWMRSETFSAAKLRKWSLVGAWAIGPTVYCILTQADWSWLRSHGVVYVLLSVGFTSWMGLALTARTGSPLMKLLNNSFLRYTGKISYGLYLFHPIFFPYYKGWALFRWSNSLHNRILGDVITLIAEMALLYLVAGLSWRFFEQPILTLKSRFQNQETRVLPAEKRAALVSA
jgi:peptidoglycan/LPS O-acetylase OafA/YrhL